MQGEQMHQRITCPPRPSEMGDEGHISIAKTLSGGCLLQTRDDNRRSGHTPGYAGISWRHGVPRVIEARF